MDGLLEGVTINMFILDGENYMMKLLINIFKNMQADLLNKYD